MPTRILLADDHPVLRSGIKSLIDESPDLIVVAEVGDGGQLAAAVATWQPDVLILDIKMPNFDAVAATQHLTATYPDLHILILIAHDDEEYVRSLLEAEALGYVLKEEATTSLITAVRSVAWGDPWLSPRYRDARLGTYHDNDSAPACLCVETRRQDTRI